MENKKRIAEYHATTVGELLSMLDDLNARFADKIGKKPAAGFAIEVNRNHRISFSGGYVDFTGASRACTYSYNTFATARDAYEHTLSAIDNFKVVTKEEKIERLMQEIQKLKGESQ